MILIDFALAYSAAVLLVATIALASAAASALLVLAVSDIFERRWIDVAIDIAGIVAVAPFSILALAQ